MAAAAGFFGGEEHVTMRAAWHPTGGASRFIFLDTKGLGSPERLDMRDHVSAIATGRVPVDIDEPAGGYAFQDIRNALLFRDAPHVVFLLVSLTDALDDEKMAGIRSALMTIRDLRNPPAGADVANNSFRPEVVVVVTKVDGCRDCDGEVPAYDEDRMCQAPRLGHYRFVVRRLMDIGAVSVVPMTCRWQRADRQYHDLPLASRILALNALRVATEAAGQLYHRLGLPRSRPPPHAAHAAGAAAPPAASAAAAVAPVAPVAPAVADRAYAELENFED